MLSPTGGGGGANRFLDFSHKNHHITSEEEQAITTAFNKIDTDGFGTITRDQLRDMLTVLSGDAVSSSDISELVNLFTEDPKSAEITFQQFRNAWVTKDLAHMPFTHSSEFQLAKIIGTQMDEVERQIVRQLRTAFDSVDENHSGFIRIGQLRRVSSGATSTPRRRTSSHSSATSKSRTSS
ncbi:hypothetical protein STCU_11697 [Strigomonas culicis]|uniref:EF-hand domain-containing protein n=1 Tax=Strigomonas culicis TaxID=28005 RepID=S9TCX9_9TRYP|nr:hypothetical protein STCU_11697 [Strigomonas culicis]|eukprot:EPY15882.1 hypothetical protein STCU_11697 [Strigomonas culicis]